MTFHYYEYKENPQITKAWEHIKKGNRQKAIEIIKAEGWTDAERQVQMIEGFIGFMGTQRNCKRSRNPN